MAKVFVEALVLGAINWGEADKMVTLLTREQGKCKAAAFGARRPKSPLAASLQLFSYVEVELTEGARISTIRQCTIKEHFRRLSEDLETIAYGSFVAELATELSPEGEPQPEVFERLLLIFRAFEVRQPRITALAAACQLLELAGLGLRYEQCVHCGAPVNGDVFIEIEEGGLLCPSCRTEASMPFSSAARELLSDMLRLSWKRDASLQVKKDALLQAEEIVLLYLKSLFGRLLRSIEFIQQLV
ncbi:DNA repair protein RecO [Selenomonas sp. TAMA-11512]|uniref:DNA repair protein RecO n=1 Tax=Selenomonas sp. TAMA-11512 TaxID=3095337 RepID=UPI00308D4D29|nr:DNA repair protein RecO [Selenomonas sp. TAMA-11512]